MGQRVWSGKWVGRVVLGRKKKNRSAWLGEKTREIKKQFMAQRNFFPPVALKTVLGPE